MTSPALSVADATMPAQPTAQYRLSGVTVILCASVITGLFFALLGYQVWQHTQPHNPVLARDVELTQLTAEIIRLDGSLTRAACLAATTAEPQWEQQYRRLEPQIDAALKTFAVLAPALHSSGPMAQFLAANRKLVELEHQALLSARKADRQQARDLMFGAPYESLKTTSEQSLAQLSSAVKTETQGHLAQHDQATRTLYGMLLAGFPSLLLTWLAAVRVLRVDDRTRKQMQRELAKERDLLSALLQHVPDRIYFKDGESRFQRCSRAMFERLGVHQETELIGKTDFDFHPEERAREFFQDEQRVLQTGVPVINKVERQISREGKEIWASVTKVPLRDGHGRITGLVGLSRDVTELKNAERETRRAQAFLQSVIQNLPIMVFIKEAKELRFVLWNKAGEELTGFPEAELLGKNDYDFFAKSEADFYVAKDRETLATGKLLHVAEETMLTRKRGLRLLATKKIPILDERGLPQYLVGISEDITDRKLAEEKLRAYATQMEQNNRELQDFAYVASHDLQEPLRKVRAFSDRLRSRCGHDLAPEGTDYLERIQNAAQRMQTLIEDLLVFSRITTRAQPFVPVDLTSMVKEVAADLKPQAEGAGAQFEIAELPTVEADPAQMRQLFHNLLGNAVKFRKPSQPPVVRVHSRLLNGQHRAAGNECCQLFVQDNGIGFDEKYLDRIFTVFQRLHPRGEYDGNGVGLAVCRKIAVRHGGSITAKSQPGDGASFIITLPLRQLKLEPATPL